MNIHFLALHTFLLESVMMHRFPSLKKRHLITRFMYVKNADRSYLENAIENALSYAVWKKARVEIPKHQLWKTFTFKVTKLKNISNQINFKTLTMECELILVYAAPLNTRKAHWSLLQNLARSFSLHVYIRALSSQNWNIRNRVKPTEIPAINELWALFYFI